MELPPRLFESVFVFFKVRKNFLLQWSSAPFGRNLSIRKAHYKLQFFSQFIDLQLHAAFACVSFDHQSSEPILLQTWNCSSNSKKRRWTCMRVCNDEHVLF